MGGAFDEVVKALDAEVNKPIPGSTRVSENVVEDEMAMFMQAQATAR